MLFGSDLDGTLIYSEKYLKQHTPAVEVVERGKYNSFMTRKSAELLKKIANKCTFVPCTTRTIDQFKRIQFFSQDVIPIYAIVSNGANLLIDGAVDLDYKYMIHKALLNDCLACEDILKEFNKFASEKWAQPMRQADEVFHYCIINREYVPSDEIAAFSKWLKQQNWGLSIQGRKLYLVPNVVNKWSALEHVAELAGESDIVTAGDSLLDIPLVKGAKYSISPAHGEIYDQYATVGWHFTKSTGILAGEEILQYVCQLVK